MNYCWSKRVGMSQRRPWEKQAASRLEAPVTRHSEKPAIFYEIIERYFPSLPTVELHARGALARPGWDVRGLEAPIDPHEP
jgi:N6-adenosine-specific RNA methylase IME4